MEKLNENPEKAVGKKTKKKIKVVFIDSLMARFRSEYIGRGTLSERQQRINAHLNACLKFAMLNNGIVFVTNQVISNPDSFFGPKWKPCGGNVVGHAATYRFYIKKATKNKRVLKIIDSPDLPQAQAIFYLERAGIQSEQV